eukprot:2168072-Amphidinium_carterae.1
MNVRSRRREANFEPCGKRQLSSSSVPLRGLSLGHRCWVQFSKHTKYGCEEASAPALPRTSAPGPRANSTVRSATHQFSLVAPSRLHLRHMFLKQLWECVLRPRCQDFLLLKQDYVEDFEEKSKPLKEEHSKRLDRRGAVAAHHDTLQCRYRLFSLHWVIACALTGLDSFWFKRVSLAIGSRRAMCSLL